jgi:hypothetical protein
MRNDVSILTDRLATIKDIYKMLQEHKIYSSTQKFDYEEILHNLYFMNKLFYDTYVIFKNNQLSRAQKIHQIMQFTEPHSNKTIFTKSKAVHILDNYAPSVVKTYGRIFDSVRKYERKIKKKKPTKKMKSKVKSPLQKGGVMKIDYPGAEVYSNNPFTGQSMNATKLMLDPNNFNTAADYVKALYSKDHMKNVQKMLDIKDIGSVINNLESKIGSDEIKQQPDLRALLIKALRFNLINTPMSTYKTYKYLFDWIFFPIYQLEQIPVFGVFVEYPLDVITLILEEMQLFIKPWAFILPLMIDLMMYAGSVWPGVGWAVSMAKVPIQFMRWPIEHFTERGSEMIQFFINVPRKKFSDAWQNMGAIFPQFTAAFQVVDDALQTINTINPHINKYTGYTNTALHTYRVLSKPFLDDPLIMLNPKRVWNEVIKPNEAIVPFLKDMPTEMKWTGHKMYDLLKLTQAKLSPKMQAAKEAEEGEEEEDAEEDAEEDDDELDEEE